MYHASNIDGIGEWNFREARLCRSVCVCVCVKMEQNKNDMLLLVKSGQSEQS